MVDGGSTDGTVDLARPFADRVIAAPRGRAVQLNAGAAAATGEVLLFLHADTLLGRGALDAVRRALADSRRVGGAFRLHIAARSRLLRLVGAGVNLRSRLLRLPYGDQAIFVRREVFDALGGFRSLHMMEDLDLVRRMGRLGRLAILNHAVTTSARRWRANGVVRTTLVNWAATAMFAAGVPTGLIRRVYDWLLIRDPSAQPTRSAIESPAKLYE